MSKRELAKELLLKHLTKDATELRKRLINRMNHDPEVNAMIEFAKKEVRKERERIRQDIRW